MAPKRSRTAALIAVVLLWPGTAIVRSQQPARKEDPCAFARPQALAVWDSNDPRQTMQTLVALVQAKGFNTQNINWSEGAFEASRAPAAGRDERLMIWLERDFARPQEAIRVFVLYGVYANVWGSGVRRVKLDSQDEQRAMGTLRQAIVDAALVARSLK